MVSSVNYATSIVPSDYICAHCNATGCKLWREYQTFSPQLLCVACAAKDQNKQIKALSPDGYIRFADNDDDDDLRFPEDDLHMNSDQIGWYVPAVPTEDGGAYWGYTSVPPEGVSWWRALSNIGAAQKDWYDSLTS